MATVRGVAMGSSQRARTSVCGSRPTATRRRVGRDSGNTIWQGGNVQRRVTAEAGADIPSPLSSSTPPPAAPLPEPAEAPTNSSTAALLSTRLVSVTPSEAAASSGSGPWQLDFSSRPVVDERGKKIWEMLLTDSSGSVRVSEFFANNAVNSKTLREAIARGIEDAVAAGAVAPSQILFFRGQMATVVTRACDELGIRVEPSRKCDALIDWLNERFEAIYSKQDNFDPNLLLTAVDNLLPSKPQDLPDALLAEQWLFVELPVSQLQQETASVTGGQIFGTVTPFLPSDDPNVLVPGLAVYSQRSSALAAYMFSYDTYNIVPDTSRLTILLGAGLNDSYRFGALLEDDIPESRAWEEAKKKANGLHFLAIGPDPNSERIDGFWLLRERELPRF